MVQLRMDIPDDLALRLQLLAKARSKSLEEVAVEELKASARIRGTPEAVLHALLSIQPVSPSLVDEMEAAIEEGHITTDGPAVFDEPAA